MTTQTQTLADFLLARIAEDEEQARKMDSRHDWSPSWELTVLYDDGPCIAATSARVLSECDAKREIVRYWNLLNEQAEQVETPFHYHATGLFYAIRTLASVYAAHPDYREEWRH